MDYSGDGAAKQSHGLRRQDIRAAVSKAAELRAFHAALLQGVTGGCPVVARFPAGASHPSSRGVNRFSVPEDYPVFEPSYEEKLLPRHHYLQPENRSLSQTWSGIASEGEGDNEEVAFDNKSVNKPSTSNNELHISSAIERLSNGTSRNNRMSLLSAAPEAEILRISSRKTGSREYRTAMTYNTCKQDTVNMIADANQMNLKNVKSTQTFHNLEDHIKRHTKHRGAVLSWLLSKSKKKTKPEMSPKTTESDMSQLLKEWGVLSLESLKKELLEASENRDAALAEVSELRSTLGELQQKLVRLESYCEELKKALREATQAKSSQVMGRFKLKKMKSISGSRNNSMPLSQEVMAEGFLQIVSESRLFVKQFCKTLIHQIEETDDPSDKLNFLLQPHQMTLTSKKSKEVLYHMEALVNHSLYQDFENCVFQKNGSPKFLDLRQEHQENFSSFVALRNLSWNEILQKGTKSYSEDFSRFCDEKMSCIVSLLNWSGSWPEQLLQSFFVAAKCIWLLHLLAFSFSPSLMILRVEENRDFDPIYMDDITKDRHGAQAPAQVKIMVTPGFYVQDRVLRCRVLCRYRSVL